MGRGLSASILKLDILTIIMDYNKLQAMDQLNMSGKVKTECEQLIKMHYIIWQLKIKEFMF